jgi:hypothetical protein
VKTATAIGGRLDLAGSREEQRQHRIEQDGLGQLCWRMGLPDRGRFHWPLSTIIFCM